VLEQADHWKHQPHNRYETTGDERFSKCGDYFERAKSSQQTRDQARDGYDKERINPEDESDYDDRNPD
jgi:hypothetical protein